MNTSIFVVVLLETADAAYCILTDKHGQLSPSAKGQSRPDETVKDAASRLLRESIRVNAPARTFRVLGDLKIGDRNYQLLVARYNMTMGPFVLNEEYIDDDTLDLEELSAIYASSPERLSPLLVCAMDALRTKY